MPEILEFCGRRGAQRRGGVADKLPEQIALKDDILKLCRETLPRHKVPAAISFVPALKVATTGKLVHRQ
jgi:acyl-coenzyme A synthetase/AMP-(fatty) acid ligase